MAMSRSARITLLLIIDIVFFFVELTVGYAVGSLALVADSFHMLNDVMSLVVALYAIKLTASNSTDSRYSYGWHRAEILAALVNGVFLLALCFSISLEALGRFFSTPEIVNPRLVVIVGSLGLASNIVGLLLFHEHGHSHGHSHDSSPPPSKAASITKPSRANLPTEHSNSALQKSPIHIHRRPRSRSPPGDFSSLYGHPAATRASLVQAANDIALARSPSPTAHRRSMSQPRTTLEAENLTETPRSNQFVASPNQETQSSSVNADEDTPLLLTDCSDRKHNLHSHSHAGSMNMRALVLHVLGDALGNVGVIATGLIIWLTEWSFKNYCDPIISLIITIIIFSSAMPLVRSASFILLQGVPPTISLDSVRDSILEVEGVLSLHELHIWQLSESKIVASVHVLASRDHDFMPVAVKIRKALHHHGIHSSTIQPEYYCAESVPLDEHMKTNGETSCLIVCPADHECDPVENACCRE
ncbi:cation efflux protein [Collybia nuda]|uniref:Cation efflux protein n=1 Tax=Collybia nuda TaxID=64659 RepID=A0A9P6CCM9_9AGAR|nr:cation efflux protein [Collybia nuda]